ncbi:MAG: M23 family metallopeptidase [Anaerolineales bacterium]
MPAGRFLSLILFLTLSLVGCALPIEEPTPVPAISPTLTAAPRRGSTSTPFYPASPTAPLRSTPIVTFTPAIFPSVTPPARKYVFPVQPVSLAHFEEGVESHGYPAIDIFAPAGTKFVAVTNGVVEFVSDEDRWQPENDHPALRGGLAVAILGEDGWRYYGSHLSGIAAGIAPGVTVVAGQLLGYVGDSGNARNKTPHLHFGISRPTYPGDWVTRRGEINPFPYLNAWLDGIDLVPTLP